MFFLNEPSALLTLSQKQAEVQVGVEGRARLVLTLHLSPRVEFIKLASECDAVNLGQGFPDFPPPDFALEAFRQAVSGDFMLNQYTKAFVSLPASPGPWTQASDGTLGEEGESPDNSVLP